MTKSLLAILLVVIGAALGQDKHQQVRPVKQATPHVTFVKEYVRKLISDEDQLMAYLARSADCG